MILLHIHDEERSPSICRPLGNAWSVLGIPLEGAADVESCKLRHCLIDVEVKNASHALRVRALSRHLEEGGHRIFVCDRADHHAVTQAHALGATHLIDRPTDDRELLRLLGDVETTTDDPPASTAIGAVALDLAFRSIEEGKALTSGYVENVAAGIGSDIDRLGIEDWLQSIRDHHDGTYQHCLIVTGLATAFGKELGLSATDIGRLTVAALLHDIGKAKVDPAILDKSGALTAQERTVIEMHPVWGEEHLRLQASVDREILNAIRHHHEMLDGSGYPDRLKGEEISDLTRLLTISDIFGALVERRSYKPPMSGESAYAIIEEMAKAGKLEQALVRAFRAVALQLRDQPVLRSA